MPWGPAHKNHTVIVGGPSSKTEEWLQGSESDPLAVEDGLQEGPALDTSRWTPVAVGPSGPAPGLEGDKSHTDH